MKSAIRMTKHETAASPAGRATGSAEGAPARAAGNTPLIEVSSVSLYYGAARALKDITLTMRDRVVTAFIGPSGCGKSTLLRCFNRKIGRASCRERV